MQIPPTAALLNAIAAMPAGAVGTVRAPVPAQPAAPARPAPAVSGAASGPPALAAAQKALAARAGTGVSVPDMGAAPPPNLPRGSIINIVV